MADEQLVRRFVQALYAAQGAIDSGNEQSATNAYHELLTIYRELNASSLEHAHKDLAHKQVVKVYEGISSIHEQKYEPSLTSIFQSKLRQEPVVSQTTVPVSIPLHTKKPIISNLQRKDYIALGFFTVLIVLVLFFKPSFIGLAVLEDDNSAPRWIGDTVSFSIVAGSPLRLDLSTMFTDRDGDELVFLATESPGLSVIINGNIAFLTSNTRGEYKIILMASDLEKVTKVPVTVTVS